MLWYALLASCIVLCHQISLVGAIRQCTPIDHPPPPVSRNAVPGPPPAPANLTAQPLPPLPAIPLGVQVLELKCTPPEGVIPSIPVPANFLGLSIELSISNDVFGNTTDTVSYQFLNYLNAVRARSGCGTVLRIGANSQDTATYDPSFTGSLAKTPDMKTPDGFPITPNVTYGKSLLEVFGYVAAQTRSEMIWGVNLANYTAAFLEPSLTEVYDSFGRFIKYLLVGNEPDRYEKTGRRAKNYTIDQYIGEWGNLTDRILSSDIVQDKRPFTAPTTCCGWKPQVVLDNGLLGNFSQRLGAITANHYAQSLCNNPSPYGHAGYTNQTLVRKYATLYAPAIQTAVANDIPYILSESSTASCIGVADVANTFTAAVWGVNAALQAAYNNHSGLWWHSGGQSTLYNALTAPDPARTDPSVPNRAFRTGPIFYSLLVLAEALRPSNWEAKVTVTDQFVPSNLTAVYNVYEDGIAAKFVIINMVSDPSGANDLNVSIPQPSMSPQWLPYKLLEAPSLAEKDNITWAGQTFGWWSEGILKGKERVERAECQNGNCQLSVPAPGVALVFVPKNVGADIYPFAHNHLRRRQSASPF